MGGDPVQRWENDVARLERQPSKSMNYPWLDCVIVLSNSCSRGGAGEGGAGWALYSPKAQLDPTMARGYADDP
jgi:hypothetical protein